MKKRKLLCLLASMVVGLLGFSFAGVENGNIELKVTATEYNQTLTINKYFSNDYTVDRGDGNSHDLTGHTTHTYALASGYNITLSLTGGATGWTFQCVDYPLVPKSGTTVTGVKITKMPPFDRFGDGATNPGDCFFGCFNFKGAIESLPALSFKTENITKVGDYFFANFNDDGKIIELPAGSFILSGITTVGDDFFYSFNYSGALKSLPDGSFDISNIITVGDSFFSYFNTKGAIDSLPAGSFNTDKITSAGKKFFEGFNAEGKLKSLPAGSFILSGITTVGDNFFEYFNYNGALTSLPAGSFNFSGITIVNKEFFKGFNKEGKLESLPIDSFKTDKITKVGKSFFKGFNESGNLVSLPDGSFNTDKITEVGNDFFEGFNESGNLVSLPDGSFNTENITTAGYDFFRSFNNNGALTSLPDSFKMNATGVNNGGYKRAFDSPNYTLNKNVSDLVAGLPNPGSDHDVFSDNQPGRCGVHENWLVNPATNCTVIPTPSGGNGGGSSGGGGMKKDYCPNGDYSNSYYDGKCGKKPTTGDVDSSSQSSSEGQGDDELTTAYERAYKNGITTMDSIEKADMEGQIIRSHLAKMMSQFAINVMGKTPEYGKAGCDKFEDIAKETEELKGYIKTACELGLMGLNADGDTAMKLFNPNDYVSRAEFGTVLSRLLFLNENNLSQQEETTGVKWYSKHLSALKEKGIMTKVDGEWITSKELRGYVMLMLMRSTK